MKSVCKFVLEKQRIYYEDTDSGGIVYHSNYLKYMDRARCEWLWAMGICFNRLAENDCFFVVCDIHVQYLKPMILQDVIDISCEVIKIGNTSCTMAQKIYNHGNQECIYSTGEVRIVTVNNKGRPILLPDTFVTNVK